MQGVLQRHKGVTWVQVVLGLLAPLVLNAGCAAAAEAACEHYKLPDADCAQLWCATLPSIARD